MSDDVVVKSSTSTVRVSTKARGDQKEIKNETSNFPVTTIDNPIVVSVSMGLTLNLGQFESARLDVFISTPLAEGELPEEAYERNKSWVEERLRLEVASIRGESALDKKSSFNDASKSIF